MSPDLRAAAEAAERVLLLVSSAVVREPEAVRVELVLNGERIEFHLSVAPRDLEAIIGSKAHTVRAIRTVIGSIGVKFGQRFRLIVENSGLRDDGTEF